MFEGVPWVREPSGASEEAIHTAEEWFGVVFPLDYRAFATKYSGGIPASRTDFEFMDAEGKLFEAVVGVFSAFDPNDQYDVVKTCELLSNRISKHLVPVVEDPSGDFICLDYRSRNAPCVTYWRHDRMSFANEFSFVSDSFSAFLAMLHDADPEE